MLIDGRSIEDGATVEADLCVVGGGAAGLTVVDRLAGAGCRVVVLESGDEEVRDAAQALNEAASDGAPYPGLAHSRIRALGGTTHRWGGWWHALEGGDFDARPEVARGGWPFGRAELEPHYDAARLRFALPQSPTGASSAASAVRALCDEAAADVRPVTMQIRPVRFGRALHARFRTDRHVSLILRATATALATSDDGRSVVAVRVATASDRRFSVRARLYVLAAGGLENPRLLLASTGRRPNGIGNEHDLVGRYFAEHLHVPIGTLTHVPGRLGVEWRPRRDGAGWTRAGLVLDESTRAANRLLGAALTLHDPDDPHDVFTPGSSTTGYASLMTIARAARRGRVPDSLPAHVARVASDPVGTGTMVLRRVWPRPATRLVLALRAEQRPDPDSRVVLDATTDRFGVPRLRLRWRIGEQDVDSIHRTQRLLGRRLAAARPVLLVRDGPAGWRERLAPAAHHMGTTRMHADPRRGVVDEHGRVHGVSNLYVAGSSVFPTTGWAPPTLTIVALATRLADHLAARLRAALD